MIFEQYLELLSESLPSMMRQAAAEDPEVQAWLERIYTSSQRGKSKGDAPIKGDADSTSGNESPSF
jgi:hypothetical protein